MLLVDVVVVVDLRSERTVVFEIISEYLTMKRWVRVHERNSLNSNLKQS